MDEKEFDEKYKQYRKEANNEMVPKFKEKSQKITDDFKKRSKEIKENSHSSKEYMAKSIPEINNMMGEFIKLSELRTNSLNYRVLKKFFTSK